MYILRDLTHQFSSFATNKLSNQTMITKSMTGFLREETQRQIESTQKPQVDHNVHHDMTTQSKSAVSVHHSGYSEEFMSGSGAGSTSTVEGGTGGLPSRLPTEIMNRPPSTDNGQLIQKGNDDDGQSQFVISADDETECVEPPGRTETFYYVTENGKEEGPVTMVEIVEKFQSLDITEDTPIWSDGMTRAQSKPLKETRRIYANLPKPPKRGQHIEARKRKMEESPDETGRVVQDGNVMNGNVSSKSKGCCVVL